MAVITMEGRRVPWAWGSCQALRLEPEVKRQQSWNDRAKQRWEQVIFGFVWEATSQPQLHAQGQRMVHLLSVLGATVYR